MTLIPCLPVEFSDIRMFSTTAAPGTPGGDPLAAEMGWRQSEALRFKYLGLGEAHADSIY